MRSWWLLLMLGVLFVSQSLQANQEATELLEGARKSKEEMQTQIEKLQV